MNKQEFLNKYPQYLDMRLDELARNLHAKYYPDKPFDEFAAEFGVPEAREDIEDIARPEFEEIAPHGRFFKREPTLGPYGFVVDDVPHDIQTYVEKMAQTGAKRPRQGATGNDIPADIQAYGIDAAKGVDIRSEDTRPVFNKGHMRLERIPPSDQAGPPPDILALAERYGHRGFFPRAAARTPVLDRQGNVRLAPEKTERPSFVKEVVGGTAKDLGRLAYETVKIPYGVAETAATFIQAAGAMPFSAVVYVRNLIDEAVDKAVYGDPVDWVGLQKEMRRVQELYMPFQPTTEFGRSTTEILSSPFTLGMEGLEKASKLITDDPQKQAAIQGIGEVLLIGGTGLTGARMALKRRGGGRIKEPGTRRGVEETGAKDGKRSKVPSPQKEPEVKLYRKDGIYIIEVPAKSRVERETKVVSLYPVLKANDLFDVKTLDLAEARRIGKDYYIHDLMNERVHSPAFSNRKVSFTPRGWLYASDSEFHGKALPAEDLMRRIKLLPKAKEVIKNTPYVDEVRVLSPGFTRYGLLGRFEDGSVVRVVVEEVKKGGETFLSVFDLHTVGKRVRKESQAALPGLTRETGSFGVGKGPYGPDKGPSTRSNLRIQQPSAKVNKRFNLTDIFPEKKGLFRLPYERPDLLHDKPARDGEEYPKSKRYYP